MKSEDAGKIPVCNVATSEATIEIKIKTLDSQTYTLKVDKQMPVPALKEQIATVTGVLSDQQRLICRGKVLTDDQLLSAYHVEDGHTLHLVVRQPLPDGFSINSAGEPPIAPRGRTGPSMVIETFSMPEQGEGISQDISRIVSAVLGSFGLPNIGNGFEAVDSTRDRGMQTEHVASDQTQLPTSLPFDPTNPPLMTDSLTTMSRYLTHLRREFSSAASRDESDASDAVAQERAPSPAFLAEVLLKCRELLTNEVEACLSQLGRNLESHSAIAESSARLNTQSQALRSGFQLYNLGALLLELGRTVMTLRLGVSAGEAVVNAGPAVFINSSSPNPLMVQPLPLTNARSNNGSIPRRIDIQIRRASSANENREEGEEPPNVRVVPIQTMVAAVPSNSSLGLYYPLVGRYQRDANTVPSRAAEGESRANDGVLEELGLSTRDVEESNDGESNTIFRLMRNLFADGGNGNENNNGAGDGDGDGNSNGTGDCDENNNGDDVEPSSSRRGEEREGEEMFLCNFLHQIMPMMSESGGGDDGDDANNNHVSRDSSTQTESTSDSEMPSAKRQKM